MKLLDYFFFTRPILFFPAWTFILLYTIFVLDESNRFIVADSSLGLQLLSFACVMGSSFILNQLADIESDRINNKLHFLPRGLISIKEAVVLAIILLVLSLFAAWELGLYHILLVVIFFINTGIAYNFKPFNWKNKAVLGALANLVMGIIAVLFAADSFGRVQIHVLGELSLIGFILFILTTLPDKEGDLQTDKRTFGNKFSEVNLLKALIATLLIALFFYTTLYATYLVVLLCLTMSLRLLQLISIELVIKLNLFAQGLFVSYFFYDYAIAMLLIYIFGRWYYKHRFDVEYPNFK